MGSRTEVRTIGMGSTASKMLKAEDNGSRRLKSYDKPDLVTVTTPLKVGPSFYVRLPLKDCRILGIDENSEVRCEFYKIGVAPPEERESDEPPVIGEQIIKEGEEVVPQSS